MVDSQHIPNKELKSICVTKWPKSLKSLPPEFQNICRVRVNIPLLRPSLLPPIAQKQYSLLTGKAAKPTERTNDTFELKHKKKEQDFPAPRLRCVSKPQDSFLNERPICSNSDLILPDSPVSEKDAITTIFAASEDTKKQNEQTPEHDRLLTSLSVRLQPVKSPTTIWISDSSDDVGLQPEDDHFSANQDNTVGENVPYFTDTKLSSPSGRSVGWKMAKVKLASLPFSEQNNQYEATVEDIQSHEAHGVLLANTDEPIADIHDPKGSPRSDIELGDKGCTNQENLEIYKTRSNQSLAANGRNKRLRSLSLTEYPDCKKWIAAVNIEKSPIIEKHNPLTSVNFIDFDVENETNVTALTQQKVTEFFQPKTRFPASEDHNSTQPQKVAKVHINTFERSARRRSSRLSTNGDTSDAAKSTLVTRVNLCEDELPMNKNESLDIQITSVGTEGNNCTGPAQRAKLLRRTSKQIVRRKSSRLSIQSNYSDNSHETHSRTEASEHDAGCATSKINKYEQSLPTTNVHQRTSAQSTPRRSSRLSIHSNCSVSKNKPALARINLCDSAESEDNNSTQSLHATNTRRRPSAPSTPRRSIRLSINNDNSDNSKNISSESRDSILQGPTSANSLKGFAEVLQKSCSKVTDVFKWLECVEVESTPHQVEHLLKEKQSIANSRTSGHETAPPVKSKVVCKRLFEHVTSDDNENMNDGINVVSPTSPNYSSSSDNDSNRGPLSQTNEVGKGKSPQDEKSMRVSTSKKCLRTVSMNETNSQHPAKRKRTMSLNLVTTKTGKHPLHVSSRNQSSRTRKLSSSSADLPNAIIYLEKLQTSPVQRSACRKLSVDITENGVTSSSSSPVQHHGTKGLSESVVNLSIATAPSPEESVLICASVVECARTRRISNSIDLPSAIVPLEKLPETTQSPTLHSPMKRLNVQYLPNAVMVQLKMLDSANPNNVPTMRTADPRQRANVSTAVVHHDHAYSFSPRKGQKAHKTSISKIVNKQRKATRTPTKANRKRLSNKILEKKYKLPVPLKELTVRCERLALDGLNIIKVPQSSLKTSQKHLKKKLESKLKFKKKTPKNSARKQKRKPGIPMHYRGIKADEINKIKHMKMRYRVAFDLYPKKYQSALDKINQRLVSQNAFWKSLS